MNFKKIFIAFCVGLPLCIAARIVQLTVVIENSNGFYKSGYELLGNALVVVVALVCVGLAVIAFKAYKAPECAPKTNIVMTVAAICVAVALICETFFENMPQTMLPWQMLTIKAVTLFCGVYFLAFAIQGITNIKLPAILHAVPCVYAILKTVFTFINISSLALISDNVLLMSSYCVLMLFFINFGKLYNGLDKELNFRKILATGLIGATLCGTQSVSVLAVNVFGKGYTHSDTSVMFTLLVFGFFIVAFLVSHFAKSQK